MCRTTDYYHRYNNNDDDRYIRLKSISLRLPLSSSTTASTTEAGVAAVCCLPETLTLMFLPRINGSLLEINGSKFRPDSPAFITLHRIPNSDVVFASYDRVRACDGVVFEIHVAENRLLKGVLRRDDDGVLRMECKSVSSRDCGVGVGEVEVSVAAGNGVVLREKVTVVVKAKKRRSSCRKFKVELEEIPEERECDVAEDDDDDEVELSDGVCSCSCGEDKSESDGGDEIDVDRMVEIEREIEEGVGWAVNVGIWVVSLGVGFLVSRASARNLRRRNFLL